jgi:hypothetical protein
MDRSRETKAACLLLPTNRAVEDPTTLVEKVRADLADREVAAVLRDSKVKSNPFLARAS